MYWQTKICCKNLMITVKQSNTKLFGKKKSAPSLSCPLLGRPPFLSSPLLSTREAGSRGVEGHSRQERVLKSSPSQTVLSALSSAWPSASGAPFTPTQRSLKIYRTWISFAVVWPFISNETNVNTIPSFNAAPGFAPSSLLTLSDPNLVTLKRLNCLNHAVTCRHRNQNINSTSPMWAIVSTIDEGMQTQTGKQQTEIK